MVPEKKLSSSFPVRRSRGTWLGRPMASALPRHSVARTRVRFECSISLQAVCSSSFSIKISSSTESLGLRMAAGFTLTHTTRGERLSESTNIGAVSYPDGKFRYVTADTISHYGVFLSGDGKTLSTVLVKFSWDVAILSGSGGDTFSNVPGLTRSGTVTALDWSPDGQVFVSETIRLLRIHPDGSDPTTIVS